MTKINILSRIKEDGLDEDRAQDLKDQVIEDFHDPKNKGQQADLAELMGMDNMEYTALIWGLPLTVLSKFRYEGWSAICIHCGKPLSPEDFSWFPKDVEGIWGLMHVECLPEQPFILSQALGEYAAFIGQKLPLARIHINALAYLVELRSDIEAALSRQNDLATQQYVDSLDSVCKGVIVEFDKVDAYLLAGPKWWLQLAAIKFDHDHDHTGTD
jgi:hypothetical protein